MSASELPVTPLKLAMDDAIGAYFAEQHDGAFMEHYILQAVGSKIDEPSTEIFLRARSEGQGHVTSLGLLSWLITGTESDAFEDDDDA